MSADWAGSMPSRHTRSELSSVKRDQEFMVTFDRAGIEFPVNLLMCFEGMEEYGSEGLDDLIRAEADNYFKDAEAVCISDN